MNKIVLSLVACAAAATAFADGAVKTSYADPSKSHEMALRAEREDVAAIGWSPVAFAFVPALEWPSADFEVVPFRFSLLVGRHLDVNGLDVGCVGSFVTRELNGLQVSPLFNCIGETRGAIQVTCGLNRCEGPMYGLQVGLINVAEKGSGIQVGLVNYGNVYRGLQIGAANVIAASACPFMPVVNFAF